MKTSLALVALAVVGLAAPASARDWKVRDVTVAPDSADARLTLAVSKKAGIRLTRPAPRITLVTIDSKDVVALWYDDKLVDRSLGREWWTRIDETCHDLCADGDVTTPLVLLALGGAGYLVAEPFSERQHFVNIRYRAGERIEWLTVGTTWLDHFWLMTDLSRATGVKWLNVPQQRTRLFWSLGDHSYSFQTWAATGDAEIPGGDYDVLLWEDGKGKGVLLVFTKGSGDTPRTIAAEPVAVEGPDRAGEFPEYCRDQGGVRRLRRLTLKHKRLVLPAWDAACRGREAG